MFAGFDMEALTVTGCTMIEGGGQASAAPIAAMLPAGDGFAIASPSRDQTGGGRAGAGWRAVANAGNESSSTNS